MDPVDLEMVLPEPLRPLVRAVRTGVPVSNSEYVEAQVYLRVNPTARFLLEDYRTTTGLRTPEERDRLWPFVLDALAGRIDEEYYARLTVAHLSKPKEKEVEPCRQPPISSRSMTSFGKALRHLLSRMFSRTKS